MRDRFWRFVEKVVYSPWFYLAILAVDLWFWSLMVPAALISAWHTGPLWLVVPFYIMTLGLFASDFSRYRAWSQRYPWLRPGVK